MSTEPHVLVDADACPVKDEIYRVALRHGAAVTIVSNSPFRVPQHPLVQLQLVGDGFDAADDWIVSRAGASTIVVTGDILLADRCLKLGARVLSPNGQPFSTSSIGSAVAMRAIMADLRAGGEVVGGPKPFQKADRSRFLSQLDEMLVALRRAAIREQGVGRS
jgi:uncharacterized protein YaiI (UPF0178 family)